MQSLSKYVSAFFKNHTYKNNKGAYTLSVLVLLSVGYFGWKYFFTPKAQVLYTLSQVKKETLTSYVSSSGQIIVKNQVDLKFQGSGNITSVRVAVGDKVRRGQVLATLDTRSALVSLKQAEASLASARASYSKVSDGATTADLLSIQSALDTSKVSLTSAQQNAVTKLIETYTQVNDIILTKTNTFFTNPNTSPTFAVPGYPLNNQILQTSIEKQKSELNAILPTWKSEVNTLSVQGDISGQLTKSLEYLNKTAAYLDNLMLALNSNTSSDNTISGYRSTVSAARSTVSSLISNVIATQQSVASAESQVKQNQASFDVKKAPPTQNDLIIAQSQVTNAEASYLNAQNNYANTSITAPFDAVVGAVTVKVGDQASSASAAVTLITTNQLVDLSLNEVDATKVKVGQKATLTFDAISDLVLAGTVAEVSPLGVVSQGVVTYNVKISLDTLDDSVKPGMSVTANIITSVRENVLAVPSEAVKTSGGSSYVEIPQTAFTSASSTPVVSLSATPTRSFVTVGISNDTSTEITNGLSEGDWVIIKISGATATKTTQQTGVSLFGGAGGGARGVGR